MVFNSVLVVDHRKKRMVGKLQTLVLLRHYCQRGLLPITTYNNAIHFRRLQFLNTIQLARYVIGLVWIYHGLFPKLLRIAPLEQAMTGSMGFSEEITYLLIKAAGIGEILFGIIFIWLYRIKVVQLLNLIGLIGLLVFAAVMTPYVLLEAFNPITTNIPLIVLGYFLLQQTGSGYAKKA